MFRPQPMVRVDILLLQRDLTAALRSLALARILHLRRLQVKEEGAGEAEQRSRLEALRQLLLELMAGLGIDRAPGTLLEMAELNGWEREAEALQRRMHHLRQRREELDRLRQYTAFLAVVLRRLATVAVTVEELRCLRFARLDFGLLPEGALAAFSPAARVVETYILGRFRGQALLAILFTRRQSIEVERELARLHFVPLPLPEGLRGGMPAALERVKELRQRVRRQRTRIQEKRAALRRRWQKRLGDRLHTVTAEEKLLQARAEFAFTERTVALSGFVPKNRLGEVKEVIEKSCGGRMVVHSSVAREEGVPILLGNPALVRPFQKILSVYGTPSYGEVEPTPLLAFGFLVLFGMMFGDLGHGALLVASGWGVRRCTRYREEGLLVMEVGVAAAFFGLLFGSVFGLESPLPPLWFSPMENIPRLMTAALALGAGLILTGLVLRVINGFRTERPRALLTDRYGAAGLLFYGGALVSGFLVYRGEISPLYLLWLAIPLVAVFCHPFAEKKYRGFSPLLLAEGTVEVLETVLGYLANTFSFLRVAAFGLAHVGLSMAVFAVADQVRAIPPGGFWAVSVHVVGNAIIILLEGLVVSVQAVRLEFYEVFSKFFRGGGTVYSPLALDAGSERRK